MSSPNKLFTLLIVLATCVGCDQATKRLAEFCLKHAPPMSFLANTFRLEYAENPGAFLGLGSDLPDWARWSLLTVFSGGILFALALFVWLSKNIGPKAIGGYALILSGGISNMIDRITYGRVVDFLNIGIGGLRTGIFNVADVTIMTGLALIVSHHFVSRPWRPHKPLNT